MKIAKKLKKKLFLLCMFILVFIISLYFNNEYSLEKNANIIASMSASHVDTSSVEENLQIHFIDVSQADAILIKQGDKAMLIDAGEYDTKDIVSNYLKKQGIEKLDFVVSTHPHSDHIGAMHYIIDNFDVERLLVSNTSHTTTVYKKFLESVKKKNIEKEIPKVGDVFKFSNASFEILGPVNPENYGDNKNNQSLGIELAW